MVRTARKAVAYTVAGVAGVLVLLGCYAATQSDYAAVDGAAELAVLAAFAAFFLFPEA